MKPIWPHCWMRQVHKSEEVHTFLALGPMKSTMSLSRWIFYSLVYFFLSFIQRIIALEGDQQKHWRVWQLIYLWLWHPCWHIYWFVRPWWRIHLGTPFPWNRNPSLSTFHSSCYHQVSQCRCFLETIWLGNFPQRLQVIHPFWQWRFLHLWLLWNITFSNVSLFLMVTMDEWMRMVTMDEWMRNMLDDE